MFFGQTWDQMGQKSQYMAKNASFELNLAAFGPKLHFLGRGIKTSGTLLSGSQWDTSFVLKTLTGEAPISRLGKKCANLTQQFGHLGQKVNFLFWNRDFCQQGISPAYPGLQIFHLDHCQKNLRFRAMGHVSVLTPVLGHFGPYIPLILDCGPQNLVGPFRPSKKWPTMTTDLVPARLRRNGRFYVWPKRVFFGQNSVCSPK